MINDGVRRRINDLPEPFGVDLLPIGVEPHDYWKCRYCEQGESMLGITTEAEKIRAYAHMCHCPQRPASDIPDQDEMQAFGMLFSDDLLWRINLCDAMILDEMTILERTWWPPARRRIKARVQNHIQERQSALADLAILNSGGDPRRIGANHE